MPAPPQVTDRRRRRRTELASGPGDSSRGGVSPGCTCFVASAQLRPTGAVRAVAGGERTRSGALRGDAWPPAARYAAPSWFRRRRTPPPAGLHARTPSRTPHPGPEPRTPHLHADAPTHRRTDGRRPDPPLTPAGTRQGGAADRRRPGYARGPLTSPLLSAGVGWRSAAPAASPGPRGPGAGRCAPPRWCSPRAGGCRACRPPPRPGRPGRRAGRGPGRGSRR